MSINFCDFTVAYLFPKILEHIAEATWIFDVVLVEITVKVWLSSRSGLTSYCYIRNIPTTTVMLEFIGVGVSPSPTKDRKCKIHIASIL